MRPTKPRRAGYPKGATLALAARTCVSSTCTPVPRHKTTEAGLRDLLSKSGGASRTPGNERRGRRLGTVCGFFEAFPELW
jgi:hypothetical protein